MMNPKKSIGITLSGGGARGLAHIGVLKVLAREGVEVAALSGASMGGIIAALYANGMTPDELEDEALRMSNMRNLLTLIDIKPPRRGLIAGDRVRSYLSRYIPPDLTFDQLNIPLVLEAVDPEAGQERPIEEGSVLDALMATSAFPGVFPAVTIDGMKLIDGGVLYNLPVHLLDRFSVDSRLAVDVSPDLGSDTPLRPPAELSFVPEFARDLYHATQLMAVALTHAHLREQPPDLLLRPQLAPDIGFFISFTQADRIIATGEEAGENAIEEIRSLAGMV